MATVTDRPIGYDVHVVHGVRDARDKFVPIPTAEWKAGRAWLKTLPARRFKTRQEAEAVLATCPVECKGWCAVGELYGLSLL
jgi:hypothetical protein